MSNLRSRKTGPVDLANISHRPIGIHGRRPECKPERPRADNSFNPLTNSQFSLRPTFEYLGSQLDSQQSYSQAVLTQTQNSPQFSQNSGEDFGLASNNAWRYGSRAQDLMNKRPRSPSHPARASQFPPNSKDRSNSVVTSQQSTAQTLLEQISNRPGAISKYMPREDMDKRLVAIENCLNGIFGRLDELQKNLLSVEGTIKEATHESDYSMRKSALQQHVLQSLVNNFEEWREEWKRGEVMHNEMEMIKLEELSEELKKIPAGVGEQITGLKDRILQSLKTELQVILNSRPQGVQDYLEQNIDGVDTRSGIVHASNSLQTKPNPTAKEAYGAEVSFNQHGSEGYRVSPQIMHDSMHTQIPQEGGWRSTRLSKAKAIISEQVPRSSWTESRNDNAIKNVNIRPAADPYKENIPRQCNFDQCKPVDEVVTGEVEDRWSSQSQVRHYNRRRVESHQKATGACLDEPSDGEDRHVLQKMLQTMTNARCKNQFYKCLLHFV